MNFSDIVKALNPKESQIFNDYLINRAVFDTRSSQFFKNSIFFTLGSEKRDGHRFIQEAYEKGIKSFVLERKEYV